MSYADLPLAAWICGGVALLILAGFAVYYGRLAWREHNATWSQLTDPNRCWDCGQPYHYPCPETTWWRHR